MWIVLLESGCWLAEGKGDPPRTLVRANAKRFATYQTAERALFGAQRMRPFRNAAIKNVSLEMDAVCRRHGPRP